MTYIQNHTLLGSLQDYNHALKDLHRQLHKGELSEIEKQVAGYIENVQQYIDEVLQSIKEDMSEAEAKTFNQYTLDTHPLEELEANLPLPGKPGQWIDWVLQRQQYMAEWCGGIAGQSISSRTTELFGQIAKHIKELNRKFATDTKAYSQEAGQDEQQDAQSDAGPSPS